MTRQLPRLGAALVLVATVVLLGACTPAPSTPEPSVSAPSSPSPDASPQPESTGDADAGDPTCESIIPASTVADFESIGWSALAEPFFVGETEVPGGISCMWADFEGMAGDHLQRFGWAPIDAATAEEAQSALLASGWLREEGPEGLYITESPDTTIATDADGYGYTYLFGDGWVELSDTKQGLLLIEWPPAG